MSQYFTTPVSVECDYCGRMYKTQCHTYQAALLVTVDAGWTHDNDGNDMCDKCLDDFNRLMTARFVELQRKL